MASAAEADHLIITEVVTKSRAIGESRIGSEFIEVVNPTDNTIDLTDVHLTDATFSPSGIAYWNITAGAPIPAEIGGGVFNDFHVRFPAGYQMAAGDTISISVTGSDQYHQAYGQLPDFELYEDGRVPDVVPEMRAVFPGSVHGGEPIGELDLNLLPALSDASESLILYQWDGNTDLVADLDFMFWGTSTSVLFDKSGVTAGASTYLDDFDPASQQPVSVSEQNFGQAYARLNAGEGTESLAGGNGLTGHDETSENLGATWQIASTQNPPQAPVAHFAAAPIFIAGEASPLTPYEGQDVDLAVEVVSFSAVASVDFLYTINGGAPLTLIGTDAGAGTWRALLPSQSEGALVAWYAVAVNVEGGTATWPAAAPAFSQMWTVGALPDPTTFPAKLLLTEVCTIGTDMEFVEITNPGAEAVDMSHYFLTDANYAPGNQYYWRITEGNSSQINVGGGAFNDFHAQFPAGLSLAAGDTIVVSVAGSQRFTQTFGFPPDLELWDDDGLPDNVPQMRWVFGDEINNSIINRTGTSPSVPTLTNGVELIVLYHWDGTSDGVTDIDVFNWKDPSQTSTSFLFSKTGVTIGDHSYLPDTAVMSQTPFARQADFGFSYQRIDASEGTQITSGSNGVLGRDETSENLNSTFALMEVDPSRRDNVVFPIEGAWQSVGLGAVVSYGSVAHTWGDFDHNGSDDLFLVRPEPGAGNLLIHDAGLVFTAQVDSFDGDDSLGGTDCVRGDYNQDGDLDVYLAKAAGADWLYSNLGPDWGYDLLPWHLGEESVMATTGADLIDTDLDGWPEFFVTNADGANKLLDGRFGMIDMLPYTLRHAQGTLGSAWCDLDGDRDPDLLFISGDTGAVISMQEEIRSFSGVTEPIAAEGRDCAWADFDNDGDFDFALMCVGADNVIHENLGDGTFDQIPLVHAGGDITTGCTWGDFDNDGFLDLYETNRDGSNVLWRNATDGTFAAVDDSVAGSAAADRAASWLDIDSDGDVDLYVSNQESTNRVIRNNLNSSHTWLQVTVAGHHWGNQSNFDAVGAMIVVEAGGLVQRRYVGGGEAGPGHGPYAQHFGLGGATTVDRVTVHWPYRLPNGAFHSTVNENVAVNQRLEIEETVYGVSAVDPAPRFVNGLRGAQPNPFNPATTISYSVDRDAVVDMDVFDVRGRRVAQILHQEKVVAGVHEVVWRGRTEAGGEAPSGVYIYRLVAGDFSDTKSMVLIR
ncbi:MAG: FG-GAP-like repeat-containing protein [Candidatus Krumholzibacteria bacterium]|nr:FG-GAP-like repeat-containing protein [Candidatus Krumholzibacteria bacterium]